MARRWYIVHCQQSQRQLTIETMCSYFTIIFKIKRFWIFYPLVTSLRQREIGIVRLFNRTT